MLLALKISLQPGRFSIKSSNKYEFKKAARVQARYPKTYKLKYFFY